MSENPQPVGKRSNSNLILVILALAGGWLYLRVQDDHREAVRTVDYDLCWTGGCKEQVSEALGARFR